MYQSSKKAGHRVLYDCATEKEADEGWEEAAVRDYARIHGRLTGYSLYLKTSRYIYTF